MTPVTLRLEDFESIDALIGAVGAEMLDQGVATHRAVDVIQRARSAAAVSDDLALAILGSAGFNFSRGGRTIST
jgi:hypothetical protein